MAIEQALTTAIEYFADPAQGRPIFNGNVYIGEPDLDPTVEINRITVTVIQEDGTRVPIAPSAQPLKTSSGGQILYLNSPVSVVIDQNYSVTVTDSLGAPKNVVPFVQNTAFILQTLVTINYDSVAAMVADTTLLVGVTVTTSAYVGGWAALNESPKGAASYNIVTAANFALIKGSAPDELGDHTLANGNIAMLDTSEGFRPYQYGCQNDSSGTTGSGTDNTLAFQAMLNAINAQNGGNLIVDETQGRWFRLTGTIRGYANTTITGTRDSKLFFDTPDFGRTPGFTNDSDDFQQAGIVFHSELSGGALINQREYTETIYLENAWVTNITIKSLGSYAAAAFNVLHKGIRFHGCRYSGVLDVKITNFDGEVLYANDYGKNMTFRDNHIEDCRFTAMNFNGRINNSKMLNNGGVRIGQCIESGGWDNRINGNQFETVKGTSMIIGPDTLGFETSGEITNNRFTDLQNNASVCIAVSTSGAGIQTSLMVSNNYIRGDFSVGIRIFNTALQGTVSVTNNDIIEEATADMGSLIELSLPAGLVQVSGNNLLHTTGFAFSSIATIGATTVANIHDNDITAPLALRGAATNYAGVIQDISTAVQAKIANNWVNGQITSSFSRGLIISTGAVTVVSNIHQIDTEAAASTDDLDTINGNVPGNLLVLSAVQGDRDIVLKDGTGNLKLAGDFTLNNTEDTIILAAVGTVWLEVSRSDNNV